MPGAGRRLPGEGRLPGPGAIGLVPGRGILEDAEERRQAARALRQESLRRNCSAAPAAAGDEFEVPREIGDYQILREVGRGGMGVVYQARHRARRHLVALKMILAGQFATELQLQRFQREAVLAARVEHPNIVAIREVGSCEGRPFIVMEWVDGGTLAERIGPDPWPSDAIARLIETLRGRSRRRIVAGWSTAT